MRLVIVALAALFLGAVPGHYGPQSDGAHTEGRSPDTAGASHDAHQPQAFFSASYDKSGLRGTDLPRGFPAPDLSWDGNNSSSNLVGAQTFSQTGSSSGRGAPFCPEGNFDQVEENNTKCLGSRTFAGAGRLVASSQTLAEINTTDRTMCAVLKPASGSAESFFADTKGAAAVDGWVFDNDPVNNRIQMIINDGAVSATAQVNNLGALAGAWIFACAVVDHGGNFKVCVQGANCGTPVAVPGSGAAINNSVALNLAAQSGGGVAFSGDLTKFWSWPQILTDAQITLLFQVFAGIADDRQAPGVFVDAATSSCWIDGKLEEFNQNWPRVGCEIGPNDTGAGTFDTGYFGSQVEQELFLQTNKLDTSWTAIGTPAATLTTTTSPWRDGRGYYRITDNDAAAVEGISQVRSDAAINTGDKMNVCILAHADSAQTIDLQVTEATGCAGSTIDFTGLAIDTSWKRYRFTHTVADGACTDFTYKITPTDWATVATQGHADLIVNLFRSTIGGTYCPQYIGASVATVTGENDSLYYLASTLGAPTSLTGQWRVSWRQMFFNGAAPDNGGLIQIDDDGAPTAFLRYLYRNNNVCESFTGTGISFLCAPVNGATTQDQRLDFYVRTDDPEVHTVRVNGANTTSVASSVQPSPTGLVRYRIMSNALEQGAAFGGDAVGNVRIYR